eukprot:2854919-Amphidinium_carterae.1
MGGNMRLANTTFYKVTTGLDSLEVNYCKECIVDFGSVWLPHRKISKTKKYRSCSDYDIWEANAIFSTPLLSSAGCRIRNRPKYLHPLAYEGTLPRTSEDSRQTQLSSLSSAQLSSAQILKRTVSWTVDGFAWEADQGHVQTVLDRMGLDI